MNLKILAIDDDPPSLELVMFALEQDGVEILGASDPQEGLALFQKEQPEVVLVDLMMPNMSGIEVLKRIVASQSGRGEDHTIVIMLTAFASVETAVDAMKAGAYDYLTKPIQVAELRLVVERALENLRLRAEVRHLRRVLDVKYGFESIVGRSKRLIEVLDLAGRAAQSAFSAFRSYGPRRSSSSRERPLP